MTRPTISDRTESWQRLLHAVIVNACPGYSCRLWRIIEDPHLQGCVQLFRRTTTIYSIRRSVFQHADCTVAGRVRLLYNRICAENGR